MSLPRPQLLSWALPVLLLGACSVAPEPPPEATARPVKTLLISGLDSATVRRFPAQIQAGRRAELAFRVPGTVQTLPVKEGDRVEQEQLVATLDDKDAQLVVNERQTTFENARKNFNRGQELVGKGAISQVDFDRLEAEFKNARNALVAARQDLSYTELKAPFAGMIARRYVEAFEEVQAKQPVLELQDLSQLEVRFDVPERLIRGLRQDACNGRGAREEAIATVTFDDLPGQAYPLTFRESATRADPDTQTFAITYTMERTNDASILPGMTANALLDLSRCKTDGPSAAIRVPAAAVTGDSTLAPQVWVVDESSLTVAPRPVQAGRLIGDQIEIGSGLSGGERIVVAGVAFLAEGMKVTLMPETEQAQPPADE